MALRTAHNLYDSKPRTKDIVTEENLNFTDMHLSEFVLGGLTSAGFISPSPIQLQAIPLARCGLDLIIQSKSGTGKTCVFVIVGLEMISVISRTTQVLVIAPTREIAVQISQVFTTIASNLPDLRVYSFIGGIDIAQDKAKLKCCHIAIGTPGRLNQLVSLGNLNLKNIRLLVVDEADQLLAGQFKNSVMQLLQNLPLNKQILAVSATYPNEVLEFLDKYMRSPMHVRLSKDFQALIGINQFIRCIPNHLQPHLKHKFKLVEVTSLLSSVSFNQCLIFSNSQLRAESVSNQLQSQGWPVTYLTGARPQEERLQAFHDLWSYRCRVLVSTDLSARGLDSDHVDLVINLDVPSDYMTYLHRVGRAGRFGTQGIAITIVCEGDEFVLMQAIATLANVTVFNLPDDYNFGTSMPEVNKLEQLGYLNKDKCSAVIAKQKGKLAEHNSKGRESQNGYIARGLRNNMHFSLKPLKNGSSKTKMKEKKAELCNNFPKDEIILAKQNIKRLFIEFVKSIPSAKCIYKEVFEECSSNWDSVSETIPSLAHLHQSFKEGNAVHNSIQKFLNYTDDSIAMKSPIELLDSLAPKDVMSDETNNNISVIDSDSKVINSVRDNCVEEVTDENLKKQLSQNRSKGSYCQSTGYGPWISVRRKTEGQDITYNHDPSHNEYTNFDANLKDYTWESYTEVGNNCDSFCHSSYDHYDNEETCAQSSSRHQLRNHDIYLDIHRGHSFPNYSYKGSSSFDPYISSAAQFVSMMEYVRTLGRMSAAVAKDYNAKCICPPKGRKL